MTDGACNRVHTLLAEVEEKGLPGDPVDFLYVDEAQDHLILEAACELLALHSSPFWITNEKPINLVLRSVCPNPDGLFFAGDTAQTISVGSTFRFSELKAFLYRLEVPLMMPSVMPANLLTVSSLERG